MDRYWFLTWSTYGTWLPGDARGFVSRVRDESGEAVIHNIPGTPYDADMPPLAEFARAALKGPPIYLTADHAPVILAQFQETAEHRKRLLLAVAIMTYHIHLVVGVPGDPDPASLLADFKSYASRALNKRWPKPASGTWWTESGSKRKLPNETAVLAAVNYIKKQEFPLLIWTNDSVLTVLTDHSNPASGGR